MHLPNPSLGQFLNFSLHQNHPESLLKLRLPDSTHSLGFDQPGVGPKSCLFSNWFPDDADAAGLGPHVEQDRPRISMTIDTHLCATGFLSYPDPCLPPRCS